MIMRVQRQRWFARSGSGLRLSFAFVALLLMTLIGGCRTSDRAAHSAANANSETAPVAERADIATGEPSIALEPPPLTHEDMHPSHDPDAPCACAIAQQYDRWCRKCNVGYVGGRLVTSSRLFSTIDPHGHVLDLPSLGCATCQNAIRTNAFCDECRMGFVDGMAYFSRLTHGLALGRPLDQFQSRCATCRELFGSSGWCDRCNRGVVGNVSYADRTAHKRVASEFNRFLTALDRAPDCEICASAMVLHRTCTACSISYE